MKCTHKEIHKNSDDYCDYYDECIGGNIKRKECNKNCEGFNEVI